MELVKPFALQTGDKIGIVAPSTYIINEQAVANGIGQSEFFRGQLTADLRIRSTR